MRSTLSSLASFNETERMILVKQFRFQERSAHELAARSNVRIYSPPGLLSVGQFCAAWHNLSIKVSKQAARACFYKYGCDSDGLLPYEVFAMRLLSDQSRLLALEPQIEGPYAAGACVENSPAAMPEAPNDPFTSSQAAITSSRASSNTATAASPSFRPPTGRAPSRIGPRSARWRASSWSSCMGTRARTAPTITCFSTTRVRWCTTPRRWASSTTPPATRRSSSRATTMISAASRSTRSGGAEGRGEGLEEVGSEAVRATFGSWPPDR